jgi:two-component system response regulator HupR/HoxA
MINWTQISQLLVVQSLKEILLKWFGVGLIFWEDYNQLRKYLLLNESHYENYFLKIILKNFDDNVNFRRSFFDKVEAFQQSEDDDGIVLFFFEGIKCALKKVRIEGVIVGYLFTYPFILEGLTPEEENHIIENLKKLGCKDHESSLAIKSLRSLKNYEKEYLKDLLGLVAQEISTYHSEIVKREERISELNSELSEKYRFHSMIGKSKKIQLIYRLLEKIANSESTVLIQGENGTGKELVAKAIHYHSRRSQNVFLAQNCSAFNDNLLDSELFGHVKGAFTGAIKDKKGLFEMAHGGTLFLDEIGDTSLAMQVKLLRVLQEGTFLPVGASIPKKVNVRILAATNRDLKEMMLKGEFREDLYYRINVINVLIPSLRERKEDIPLLMEHFLESRCGKSGLSKKNISKKCMEKLLDYSWPGNVRELENEVERLVVLGADEKILTHDMLSSRILEFSDPSPVPATVKMHGNLKDATQDLEIYMIKEGLKRCKNNKSKLAKELGISRASLIMKVERYLGSKSN